MVLQQVVHYNYSSSRRPTAIEAYPDLLQVVTSKLQQPLRARTPSRLHNDGRINIDRLLSSTPTGGQIHDLQRILERQRLRHPRILQHRFPSPTSTVVDTVFVTADSKKKKRLVRRSEVTTILSRASEVTVLPVGEQADFPRSARRACTKLDLAF